MTGVPMMIFQLLLSLSFLVIIHECGHFFPAKWFKTKVEKFYLFFDPWFSLFKTKKGETEYGIGWLPLGGYVKIAGMVDESFDTEKLKEEPKPWEFRSKPAWQRLIIMLGGVTVNFIAGFLLLAFMLGKWGDDYIPNASVKEGILTDSLGKVMGLRDGDKILKVGSKDFINFDERVLKTEILFNDATTILVERDGQQVTVQVPEGITHELSAYKNKKAYLIMPRAATIVKEYGPDSPAQKAGVQLNDRLISIDGKDVRYYHDYAKVFKDLKLGDSVTLVVSRNLEEKTFRFPTSAEKKMRLLIGNDLKLEKRKYGFFEAIPAGIKMGMNLLNSQIKGFGQMFKGKVKASESLGGFASITSLFPKSWDWENFIRITAVLSLILGFMNLLPIPGLDGGHVIFLLFEMVTGKKLSDKFVEKATMVGFILLIALMVYANGLDVFRFLKK